uniref:Ribosomal protein 11 n=1 Tax=Babesia duncani TaxID=323732 RepID=A0A385GNJ6_9APIC|nr:ribosomal protein 11 [Babesia duncani]
MIIINNNIYEVEINLDDEELNLDKEEINLNKEEINLDEEEINLYEEEINLDEEEINLDEEEINLDEEEINFYRENINFNEEKINLDKEEINLDKEEINLDEEFIILYILFKKNNIFITIVKFIKYFEFFTFSTILKSFSCGLSSKFKNTNKLSLHSYIQLSLSFIMFLLNNNLITVHLLLKNNKKYEKYALLNVILIPVYQYKFLKLLSIYHYIPYSYNGCRLKKRRFV